MKYCFSIILMIISFSVNAQSKVKRPDWDNIVDVQPFGKADTAWIKGDTVEFGVNTSVKFIKIGDDIYQIIKHNPTLEKVTPPPLFRGIWQGTMPTTLPNPNSMEVPINK